MKALATVLIALVLLGSSAFAAPPKMQIFPTETAPQPLQVSLFSFKTPAPAPAPTTPAPVVPAAVVTPTTTAPAPQANSCANGRCGVSTLRVRSSRPLFRFKR